jgi:GAF domain-containing protein
MTESTHPKALNRDTEATLATHFVALADTLVADFDVVDLMDRLAASCVELLKATAAGILLLDQRGNLALVASSSEETRLLELFQLQNEQGPCLDCIRTGRPVTVDDLDAEAARWPLFAEKAAEVGFRSVHAVPLRLRSEIIGGLNLFRQNGPQLTQQEQAIAQALADVATVGILQQRTNHRSSLLAEQLQTALLSRVIIEQAKGVLSEFAHVSMDEAYRALRTYARNGNHRLSEVAQDVVLGQLDLTSMEPSTGWTAGRGQ